MTSQVEDLQAQSTHEISMVATGICSKGGPVVELEIVLMKLI
jgi:hypothetical protein